jgi:thymidine kinase
MNIIDDLSYNCGFLDITAGPMFSGKTSKLVQLYKQFTFCGISTLVINHLDDKVRYSNTQLSTHDNNRIDCIMVKDLNEIIDLTKTSSVGIAVEDFKKSKIILINEIQFFQEELVEWIKIAIDIHHKHIYVCGLDGDFQRKKFGNWIEELLPFCDSYIKLSSFCIDCKKKKAIFTHRLSSETTQKVIGTDCYVPLCRFCYNAKNKCTPHI